MTVVIGLMENGLVYMGADSIAIPDNSYSITTRQDPKIFRNGVFLIGFTGPFRMGNLLRFRLQPPEQPAGMDHFEYMATLFIDAVRDCFRQHGYLGKTEERDDGGTFLVGYREQLYEVYDDFQVGIPHGAFAAVGAGRDVALGAMAAMEFMPPRDRLNRSLQISEQFCAAVRGPFRTEVLPVFGVSQPSTARSFISPAPLGVMQRSGSPERR